jgi:predicted ester cyclase
MDTKEKNKQITQTMIEVINAHRYDLLAGIMHEEFIDHHGGLGSGITSRGSYEAALRHMHEVLDLKSELTIAFSDGDHIVDHVILRGRHISEFMGIQPTGREVEWSTIEIYRIEDGKIRERWAIDDMAGLLSQLGYSFGQ